MQGGGGVGEEGWVGGTVGSVKGKGVGGTVSGSAGEGFSLSWGALLTLSVTWQVMATPESLRLVEITGV